MVELSLSKMVEMVFESIPAAIITTRAFIISEERSSAVLASIIISCCTTGFAAASMWFDMDTSPGYRKSTPKLFGATPDTSRGLFFLLLVMSGALQVTAKSFSSALLYIASPKTFLAYMVGDHVLYEPPPLRPSPSSNSNSSPRYQLYNAVRGDHCYYSPGAGVFMSVLCRIIQKSVVDFTSCWLIRSPLTMHNSYFLFNQLTTHASVFASVHIYASGGGDHLPTEVLWAGAGSLFAAWALTYERSEKRARRSQPSARPSLTRSRRYITLACMFKPEYRGHFYSSETCVQFARAAFHGAETDEEKMNIFFFNEAKWESYKDEVLEFTHANWTRWKEEQPAWFTEKVIQGVPDEYIPVAALSSLNAAQGGKRRRSSFGLVEVGAGVDAEGQR
jgi:hypothetical protein